MNVVLFGFMGVGKTVVGKALAELTGMEYVDLDEKIVENTGRTIPEIFDEGGEAAFREIERAVTKEVSGRDGLIIACGGGTVLDGENLASLRSNARMVLLSAEPEIIIRRVEAEGDARPLLKVKNRLERIRSLLEAREPTYRGAADIVVDTSFMTPEEAAREIVVRLFGERVA